MKVRLASLLVILTISSVMSCTKTDDSGAGNVGPTPTSMVGTWKVTALTFNPVWTRTVNGTPERYTDYVQFLKRINETCLTDVVWTFTESGSLSTNMNSLASCGANGPNSTFIVNYLVESQGTYVEGNNQLQIRGKQNVTSMTVGKSFAPDNLVNLQWEDDDISNQNIPTTYTLTLKKQ